jgi:AraC-like DNA-binding protein
MSDNAVIESLKDNSLRDLIDDTLEVRLQSCACSRSDKPRLGRWVNFGHPTFALLKRGEAVTEFKENRKIERFQGDLCYLPGNVWRRTIITGADGGDTAWCRCRFTVFNGFDLLSLYDIPRLFTKESALRFQDIQQNLINLGESENPALFEHSARRRELCYSLLSLVLAESRLKPEAFHRIINLQRFEPVLKYLNKHFCEVVKVDTLAEIACLSKSQFHRQFKAAFSVAPFEYLKKMRVQNACSLLWHSDLSILEVGEHSGWNDQFHFSRIFKASVGVSPWKYREHVREDFESFLAGF